MEKGDVCEIRTTDAEKVKKAKSTLMKKDIKEVAKIFRALSDDTRLKIASALTVVEELCVCDVAHVVDCSVATASHHLRLLRNLGLAKYRKQGKQVYYSLDDDHVRELIEIAMVHQQEVADRGTN